jgi:hypothetical protein
MHEREKLTSSHGALDGLKELDTGLSLRLMVIRRSVEALDAPAAQANRDSLEDSLIIRPNMPHIIDFQKRRISSIASNK